MELENLKKKIKEDIINSQLRIDCVYYVLKDVFRDISDTYNAYLLQEKQKRQEKGEEK